MDQQLELKLDVKEAPAIPTDHPQWDISESESEKEDQHGNESEFTTDSSDEGDWILQLHNLLFVYLYRLPFVMHSLGEID